MVFILAYDVFDVLARMSFLAGAALVFDLVLIWSMIMTILIDFCGSYLELRRIFFSLKRKIYIGKENATNAEMHESV